MQSVIGIDIGGTTTKLGAINLEGAILCKNSFSTAAHSNEESFLQELKERIDAILETIGRTEIVCIGAGAPMANYYTGIVKGPANLSWKKEVNLKSFLENIYGLSTVITNDANLAAIGEKRYGQAKNLNSFVSIAIGTGLGSGMFLNGELLHGKSDLVGELGHTTVKKNGRSCGCGKRGCLETYVSANGIRRTFFKLLAEYDAPSTLRQVPYDQLDPGMIHEAARAGDETAKLTFDYTGDILGMKIADIISSFEPEAIFLSGGLANAGDLLLNPTRDAVKRYLLKGYPEVDIRLSKLKPEEISILGGGALAWDYVQNGVITKKKIKSI
jgi:glucokinase